MINTLYLFNELDTASKKEKSYRNSVIDIVSQQLVNLLNSERFVIFSRTVSHWRYFQNENNHLTDFISSLFSSTEGTGRLFQTLN